VVTIIPTLEKKKGQVAKRNRKTALGGGAKPGTILTTDPEGVNKKQKKKRRRFGEGLVFVGGRK